jgi:hypothetical protein
MKKVLFPLLAVAACLAAPAARADTWQFSTQLLGSSEVPPNASAAHGLALLAYNDHDTVDLADDTFDFTLSAFDLSSAITGFHIHGAATASESAPVRIDLAGPGFINFVSGNSVLIGGGNIAAPMFPDTPASATNAGHPAMSFLDALRNGLAYVNVHTTNWPGGEVRGQFIGVVAIPEPSTYALMLAGLAGVIALSRRRRT